MVQHCTHEHVACSALDATGERSLVGILGLAVAFNLCYLVLQLLVVASLVNDVDVESGLGKRGRDCVALGVDIVVRDGEEVLLVEGVRAPCAIIFIKFSHVASVFYNMNKGAHHFWQAPCSI